MHLVDLFIRRPQAKAIRLRTEKMTNLSIINLSRAAFALLLIMLLSPPSHANDPDWQRRKALIEKELGIDSAEDKRGYKIVTPDEAIVTCLENERKVVQSNRMFRTPEDAYQFAITYILPSLYAKKATAPLLGALNLNEMFNRFKEIRVCENYYARAPIQADPNRATDLYLPEQKFVILNMQFSIASFQTKKEIMLHVLLGASGYEDNNYSLTQALLMAEKPLGSHTLAMFPQTPAQLYRNPNVKSLPASMPPGITSDKPMVIAGGKGGFTGSGGGGDSASSLIKRAMLELAPQIGTYTKKHKLVCQKAWSHQATYIQDIQALQLESNSNMLDSFQRNPNGGYFIRISTYTYNSTGDITAKTHLGMILGILEDYCAVKYGGR